MDEELGISGRSKEIKAIHKFIVNHVESNKSGILYLTGPPGTGKTMSVNIVLNRIVDTPKLHLNCFKASSSRVILNKIWMALNLGSIGKKNESEIVAKIAKKFSGRTCKPFLMVLDEIDALQKSGNYNLFSTIFSWTKLDYSKLILVGIANTHNLTARCQTIVKILGKDDNSVTKIIFKPYSSKEIYTILQWYLSNHEQFEEATVDAKAVEMISKKFARDKGDIRGAIDALSNTVDDVLAEKRRRDEEKARILEPYPTPPSTPPPMPCRELANIASVANSVKKRQRQSHYFNDNTMAHHEVVLICLHKFCSRSKDGGVDKREFYGKVSDVLQKYGVDSSRLNIDAAVENLEMQGLVVLKKRTGMHSPKIILKASEAEISKLTKNMELISNYITNNL